MVGVEVGVGMRTFGKFVGAIDETGGMPQEDVRVVDGEVGMAPLRGDNDDMAVDTTEGEGKEVSDSATGKINDIGKKV